MYMYSRHFEKRTCIILFLALDDELRSFVDEYTNLIFVNINLKRNKSYCKDCII